MTLRLNEGDFGFDPVSKEELELEKKEIKGEMTSLTTQLLQIVQDPKNFNSLQELFDEFAGKTVTLKQNDYLVSETILIREGTTLIGNGSRFYSNSPITILSLGSNVKISDLEIEGTGNTVFASNGAGISVRGVSASEPKTNVHIQNCVLKNIGSTGIVLTLANNITIRDTEIKNMGYAGVGVTSCSHVLVDNAIIDNVSPGDSKKNAYGVYFSRTHSSDLVNAPLSQYCSVMNSKISNIPTWEGLDTHGGAYITFRNNNITNCKTGIALVSSKDETGAEKFSPKYCTVESNIISLLGSGNGVTVEGIVGDKAEGNKVLGNSLFNCGEDTNASSGGIEVTSYTKSTAISSNYLKNSFANAIAITGTSNDDLVITDNTIEDVQSSTYTAASGIALSGYYSNGVVANNTLRHLNDSLNVYVSERGMFGRKNANNKFVISNNTNNFVTPYHSLDYDNTSHSVFGNANLLTGIVVPEGNVTANVGSIYIKTNGGSSTTLYIKESGSNTNTGWVAK